MIVETSAIKSASLEIQHADAWQLECMRYCTGAVDLFRDAAQVVANTNNKEVRRNLVTMQTLGIRVLNSIGAADELMLQGFYQPAAIMIRDIVECSFLLDLFSREPEHLPKWIALGKTAGLKGYRPKTVRKMLNKLDSIDSDIRDEVYSFYSQHGLTQTQRR